MTPGSSRNEAAELSLHPGSFDARNASRTEHELTTGQAFRIYRKAIMWSVIVSLATIMDGYDLQIITAFYAYPTFQKKFGERLADGTYSIPASWQLAINLGSNCGMVIGAFGNGWLAEHIGSRRMMLYSYVALAGFIFISFFASNIQTLLAGAILCGLPWGVFATTAPLYAVEVCPLVLRSYLATFVSVNWIAGRILGTGVLQGLKHNSTEWSYRIPYALQWVWPIPLAIATSFAPESPWWQVRRGRFDAAHATIKKLSSHDTAAAADRAAREAVAMMAHTIQREKEAKTGGRYIDCFRGVNLWRTEIASVSWGGQVLAGFAIQNYLTYFFAVAGLGSGDALKLSLGVYGVAYLCTALSCLLQARFGRRQIYLAGMCVLALIMLLIALLDFAPPTSGRYWGQCSLMIVWYGCYGLSVGPVPYAIATEVPSSQLRTRTVAIARNTYYAFAIINIVVAPYLLNPTAADLKGKAAFPAAGFSLALLAWAWRRLPETKGRTFDELDLLFEKRVGARRFSSTNIDVYDSQERADEVVEVEVEERGEK